MKKLVTENLNEWFVEDPQVDGDGREEHASRKKGFYSNIEQETLNNNSFRKVLYTGENMQLVLMSLEPKENIGLEVHDVDQFFRFESGNGQVIINNNTYDVKDGDSVIIPASAKHDIINTGNSTLKLYTLYSPPQHLDGIEYQTKEEAENSNEEFDGEPTE
ncbi:cupin domain-containing protein [Candidatus Woesearchaeota archaeon]|nr:cupin domain-containing protein [Candidatus Woesearchaeota archaeon]